MKNLREIRIEFDRPGATYSPGEIVAGRILLDLSGPINIQEIRVKAKGKAYIDWVGSSGGRQRSITCTKIATEHYFGISNRLDGGIGQLTLPTGQHSFPFSFNLPNNLPSSFEHKTGHIRYTVKAIFKRPWRFNHKSESLITVIAPHDLNHIPANAIAGINDEINRHFSYSFCSDIGSAKVSVRSRVSAFVPGETIELTVNYDNDSTKVNLTKIKMQLEKRLKFYSSVLRSRVELKHDTQVIRVIESKVFNKRGETVLRFDVPPLPPSNLNNCKIITIKYALVVKIGVSGMRRNISRTYLIEIGTIPLRIPYSISYISKAIRTFSNTN